MFKALSKQQICERDRLVKDLNLAKEQIEASIAEYNRILAEAERTVQAAVDDYNALVNEAETFSQEIANEIAVSYEEKSERWQESERGCNYNDWYEQWNNVQLEEVQANFPAELDEPDLSAADELESLPLEPE